MKSIILIILLTLVYESNAQVDSIWQAYQDSGEVYRDMADLDQAITWFNKAKEYLDQEDAELKFDSCYIVTIGMLGSCYRFLSKYDEALPYILDALESSEKTYGKDHSDYGLRLNNVAGLYASMGQFNLAIVYMTKSLDNTRKTKGIYNSWYGMGLNNLAAFYSELGRYEEALPHQIQGLAIIDSTLGKDHAWYRGVLNGLANRYKKLGQYDKALPLYLEALELTEKDTLENPLYHSIRLNDTGELFREIGRHREAQMYFLKALEIIKQRVGKNHRFYSEYLCNLAGELMEIGHEVDALKMYTEALDIAAEILGKNHPEYADRCQDLSACYRKTGYYKKALSLGSEAYEITAINLGDDHPIISQRLINLARIYADIEEQDESLRLLDQAVLNTKKNLGTGHPDYANHLYLLSEHYRKAGFADKAMSLLLEVNKNLVHQIEEVFSVSGEEHKGDFLRNHIPKFDRCKSFIYNTHIQHDTLSYILYNNELLLKGLILNNVQQTQKHIELSENQIVVDLFVKWRNLRTQIGRQYIKPLDQRLSYLDSLEIIANTLEDELVIKSSHFAKHNRRIDWKEVRDKLEEGEAAIEFMHFRFFDKKITDSILYVAMILTPEVQKPIIVPLFEESQLITLDQKFDPNLYNLIWEPIDSFLNGIQTIYFVPSGILHQVAYSAITLPKGGFLIDHFNLVQLNSTRQLVYGHKKTDNVTAILYGGIKYEYVGSKKTSIQKQSLQLEVLPQIENNSRNNLNFLEGSLQEVKHISNIFKKKHLEAKVVEGSAASESDFKALSGRSPKVLHIATHGFFLPDVRQSKEELESEFGMKFIDDPMFRSGLVFSGAEYAWTNGSNPFEDEDGILTAYEISNMDLSNTDLIVLSACETGLGDIKGHEGVYGLQRAFKLAGVDNLILSLWQVSDKETSEFMTLFYTYWLRGYDIRTAFQKTQQEMSKKHPPEDWAAFVLIGDIVEPQHPKKSKLWIWMIGGVITLGAMRWMHGRLATA